jgi:hypothetical protein
MSKANMHKFHMEICGRKWTILIKNEAQYEQLTKKHPDVKGSRAVTFTKPRQIYFNCSTYHHGDQVARHELVHAFAAEMFHHDLFKTEGQIEEFFCVLFEIRGQEIIDKAIIITKKLARYHKQAKAKGVDKDDETDE